MSGIEGSVFKYLLGGSFFILFLSFLPSFFHCSRRDSFYLLGYITRRSEKLGIKKSILPETVKKMLIFGVIKDHWKKKR